MNYSTKTITYGNIKYHVATIDEPTFDNKIMHGLPPSMKQGMLHTADLDPGYRDALEAVDQLLEEIAARHMAKKTATLAGLDEVLYKGGPLFGKVIGSFLEGQQSFESNLPTLPEGWTEQSDIQSDDYRTIEKVENQKHAENYDRAEKVVGGMK